LIEYDRFENIEYLAKGGFSTIYKATWKDGYITNWILKIINGKDLKAIWKVSQLL